MGDVTTSQVAPAVSPLLAQPVIAASAEHGAKRLTAQRVATVVVTAVGYLVLWQVLCSFLKLREDVLPRPTQVASALQHNWRVLSSDLWITAKEVLGGLALSVGVGVPLGIVIALSRKIERAVYPLLIASQSVPVVAIAPLFLIWFGFGFQSKLYIAALIGFFPIVVNTFVGLNSVDQELLLMAKANGGSEYRNFMKVRWMAALPMILTGAKLAGSLAVIGAVVAEFVAGNAGLGYEIVTAQGSLNTSLAFAAIALLVVSSLVLWNLLATLERVLVPWHQSQRRGHA